MDLIVDSIIHPVGQAILALDPAHALGSPACVIAHHGPNLIAGVVDLEVLTHPDDSSMPCEPVPSALQIAHEGRRRDRPIHRLHEFPGEVARR